MKEFDREVLRAEEKLISEIKQEADQEESD